MTPQPEKQTFAIHILTNISRSEGNRQSDKEIWSVNRI